MRTPWAAMLRTAAGWGVGPETFWRLSLREWRMLTEAPTRPSPMGRRELERMAEAWPDDDGWGGSPSTASRSPSPSLHDREET